jgi:hypothetical protein
MTSGEIDGALRVACVANNCFWLLEEGLTKSAPTVRVRLERYHGQLAKSFFGGFAKAFAVDVSAPTRVIARVVELKLLKAEEVILACGAAGLLICHAILHAKAFAECETVALFDGVLALLRRVCPSPFPAEWWVATCAKVVAKSVQHAVVMACLDSISKVLDPAMLESASWRGSVLAEAVHICKVNASAELSARPTMSYMVVMNSLWILETAAKVESHTASMLYSGVIEALDYACANDFAFGGTSVSNGAAGALLALVGRNEGGKTLSRSSVNAVLDLFADYFDPSNLRYVMATAKTIPSARRVATMAISDANKKIMLQHDKLLDTLVTGLLLDDDNPRRGQEDADTLQEACVGALHELALYGPGTIALRSHKGTMEALRILSDKGAEAAQTRAAGALFELDEEARSCKRTAASADHGETSKDKSVPHIMASYNWGHQDTILRLVKALQARGYAVWVDVEQMKGSTVDAMAEAVEGAQVMLIGVSRAYKESSNCRMEAQYGIQRQKDMIPLMMQEGYQPDGWLGMLLGTKLWHPLFGETLSSESVFEDRMSALAREIGSRGRADALWAEPSVAEPMLEVDDKDELTEVAALRSELEGMRLKALERRAVSEGVPADAVDDAMDGDDPKSSLVTLIIELPSSRGPVDRLLAAELSAEAATAGNGPGLEGGTDLWAELVAMRIKDLRSRAKADGASLEQLEAAADADDPKAAVVELLLSMLSSAT